MALLNYETFEKRTAGANKNVLEKLWILKVGHNLLLFFVLQPWLTDIYPERMRRGKVIGLSVCLSVVITKIARSRHLGT